jgi:hypothetical protein
LLFLYTAYLFAFRSALLPLSCQHKNPLISIKFGREISAVSYSTTFVVIFNVYELIYWYMTHIFTDGLLGPSNTAIHAKLVPYKFPHMQRAEKAGINLLNIYLLTPLAASANRECSVPARYPPCKFFFSCLIFGSSLSSSNGAHYILSTYCSDLPETGNQKATPFRRRVSRNGLTLVSSCCLLLTFYG